MFTLIMTYCLLGQPCVKEAVAYFPQWDVGQHICNLAKPGIEAGVRRKLDKSTRVTFTCVQEDEVGEPEIPHATLDSPKNTTFYNGTDNVLEQGLQLLERIKR